MARTLKSAVSWKGVIYCPGPNGTVTDPMGNPLTLPKDFPSDTELEARTKNRNVSRPGFSGSGKKAEKPSKAEKDADKAAKLAAEEAEKARLAAEESAKKADEK